MERIIQIVLFITFVASGFLHCLNGDLESAQLVKLVLGQPKNMHFVWRNVVVFLAYHCIALEGLYYMITLSVKYQTIIWFLFLKYSTIQGITAGVHRLWTHRCYKAKLPLRILLCLVQTISFQGSIYEWVRDHRVHHKYSDTDADPHNATRGFFFSHMGWMLVRKHPDVITKGKTIDLSDLMEDPVVCFQRKYYVVLGITFCFVFPSLVPWYFWNEDLYLAFTTAGMLRYLLVGHYACLVNSVGHMWGTKPYDKDIEPVENSWISFLTQGEGWHNYHHSFPYDYRAGEVDSWNGNLTTCFIDLMAKVGWAYGLKTAPREIVQRKKKIIGAEY